MKKIALIIPSPRIGGGERVMVDLANAFVRRGYAVDLLVLRTDGHFAHHLDSKIRVVSLQARRITLSLPKLVRYFRREQPPVVLALDGHSHLLALVARSLSGGVPIRIVLRIGNMLSVLYKRYASFSDKLIPPLSRMWYPKADAAIAVSQGVARDIAQTCGIPKEKITVIFNPKNVEHLQALSRESISHKWLGENKDRPVIIASGRLRPQKGFEDLFEAFALLNRRMPSRLIILGPGGKTTSDKFAAQIERLQIAEDVDLAGYVDNPHAYTARADVFVMPSLWEGLPNALIEALICGTPIVSTDCDSGPREILAPDTDPFKRLQEGIEWAKYGVLVPVHGTAEMAEALERLLTDSPLLGQCQREGKERAAAFDEEKIVDQYLQVLDPLGNGKQS